MQGDQRLTRIKEESSETHVGLKKFGGELFEMPSREKALSHSGCGALLLQVTFSRCG